MLCNNVLFPFLVMEIAYCFWFGCLALKEGLQVPCLRENFSKVLSVFYCWSCLRHRQVVVLLLPCQVSVDYFLAMKLLSGVVPVMLFNIRILCSMIFLKVLVVDETVELMLCCGVRFRSLHQV